MRADGIFFCRVCLPNHGRDSGLGKRRPTVKRGCCLFRLHVSVFGSAPAVLFISAPSSRPRAWNTDASSWAMTSIPSFSLKVFCPITTTSPLPGSTMNGIVNRTIPHGVSIVRWSGHARVTILHCWPNDVTNAHAQQTPASTRFASSPIVAAGPLPAPPTLK